MNTISMYGQRVLAKELPHLEALRELYLDCPNVQVLAPGLGALKSLELLCIGNGLDKEDWESDAEVAMPMPSAGAAKLASCFASWCNLTKLDMKGCGVDDAGALALAGHLSALSGLRWWNLQDNAFGIVGMEALAPWFSCLTELTALKMGCGGDTEKGDVGNIGDDELLVMSGALEGLRRLSELALVDNSLGDVGVRFLAACASRMRTLRQPWHGELFKEGAGGAG